jgi:DNA-directed RNA polymerase specialized sigma24 family protein
VELRPALFAALDTLTAQQRAIVVLRYFDDRSEADVAQLRMLEQTDTAAPAAVNGHRSSTGRDLYLSVTRARAVPRNPYR